jgi:hypothetical protein
MMKCGGGYYNHLKHQQPETAYFGFESFGGSFRRTLQEEISRDLCFSWGVNLPSTHPQTPHLHPKTPPQAGTGDAERHVWRVKRGHTNRL